MAKASFTNPFTGEVQEYSDRLGRPLTPWGAEILDPTPIAPPVGYKRQPTMVEHIRAAVKSEMLRREAEALGADTFEESEDFDVGDDDDDPHTPYENDFDPPIDHIREAVEAEKAKKATPPKATPSQSPEGSPEPSPAPPKKEDKGP